MRAEQNFPWENNVRKVVPYVPGDQPDKTQMIKLNTNENPYPPSPQAQAAADAFSVDQLRLYSDPGATPLVEALGSYYGVGKERVFVGVGSDDVLALAYMTFFNSDQPILFPDITYSFYPVWADMFRVPYETQPLDENFRLRAGDYKRSNGGIVFPNPNAPTGIYEELSFVEEIVAANPSSIVIVDEAYIDFAGPSAIALIDKYDNLLVVQTFSKSRSMAGMRIGYAIGNEKLIAYMNASKHSFNSYTMNTTSLVFGVEAVKDEAYFKATIARIIRTREWFREQLDMLGFETLASKTNFVFTKHPQLNARKLFEALRDANIYVRHFPGERTGEYLRITIGTDEEMKILVDFLRHYQETA